MTFDDALIMMRAGEKVTFPERDIPICIHDGKICEVYEGRYLVPAADHRGHFIFCPLTDATFFWYDSVKLKFL